MRYAFAICVFAFGALAPGLLALSACGPAPAAPPAQSVPAAPAANAPAPPGASGGALAEDIAACVPPVVEGSAWVETARTADGSDTYVLVEPAASGQTADFAPAVLRLRAGDCEGHLVYETDSGSDSDMRPPEAAFDRLLDQSFAWHVRQAGGADAYADIQRTYNGGTLVACPPGDDLGPCVAPWLARRLRQAGIAVGDS